MKNTIHKYFSKLKQKIVSSFRNNMLYMYSYLKVNTSKNYYFFLKYRYNLIIQ